MFESRRYRRKPVLTNAISVIYQCHLILMALVNSVNEFGSDRRPDAVIIESKTSQLVTIIMSSGTRCDRRHDGRADDRLVHSPYYPLLGGRAARIKERCVDNAVGLDGQRQCWCMLQPEVQS